MQMVKESKAAHLSSCTSNLKRIITARTLEHEMKSSFKSSPAPFAPPHVVDAAFVFPGVTKMYEGRLKEVNPHQVHITYDITDLYGFIDELGDLSALV